jgi:hypothetical protein
VNAKAYAPASGRLAAAIATNRAIPRLIRDGVERSNERTRSIEVSFRAPKDHGAQGKMVVAQPHVEGW